MLSKREDGANVDVWTFDDLKQVVNEFIIQNQDQPNPVSPPEEFKDQKVVYPMAEPTNEGM